jgi:glucuronate isomerase
MQAFISPDFLLQTPAARELYHTYAENLPIIDFHCHLNPAEIAADVRWNNLTELWLGNFNTGDHYKWRALRTHGTDERYITGDMSPYEKFEKYAELMPYTLGNPLFHWTQLELKRYFGIDKILSPITCREIWEECNEKLKTLSAKSIISASKVSLIYTTDDPSDDLRYHKDIKKSGFGTAVLPAWRPDKAINIDKPGFADYIRALGDIKDFDALKTALSKRMDYFHALGCLNSDHGLDYIPCNFGGNPEAAFKKALSGATVTEEEAGSYKTALLTFLAAEYRRRGWVMQLHFGAARNANPLMFKSLGPDTGFDAIHGDAGCGKCLAALLGAVEASSGLPKTIIYSLNPADNAQIGAVVGCFQSSMTRGKIQQGSAWWFNDTKYGMEEQLKSLASLSLLPDFVGMVTDSRSFLSYTRHEYFRRILCNLIGSWVEGGEYPRDMKLLGQIVSDICYNNAKTYFKV